MRSREARETMIPVGPPLARDPAPLQLWGGVECTVNRVGDRYFDQVARSGHDERLDDLDRFAALGIRTLRYPVLWERVAPEGLAHARWDWTDARLERLRSLGIRPIVGFTHHGSGPRDTSLLHDDWAPRLAEFATAVAERYPWIDAYTPVNEPLTTARFAALYGLWYPHARDDRSFACAFVTQIDAIGRAMRAVRAVNPRAELVQTEDLGKTHSTPKLRYQADFENERRWLTVDTLCGRVTEGHPLWRYLRDALGDDRALVRLAEQPCAPDIVGINHYLTSERFLDQRLSRYPASTHGGNGHHRYADVEAVRVCVEGPDGPERLFAEAWDRYRLPIAVTEAHLGCTREQQLRWLAEVWRAAASLRERGADVRAVTAWSLLGAYDWNTLLTRDEGRYEPGIFDVRAPNPRPTALARMARSLASSGSADHPAARAPGWWRVDARLAHQPVRRATGAGARARERDRRTAAAAPPLLITGATGTLGRAFARACDERGLAYRLLGRAELDIARHDSVESALRAFRPWAIVNAAGYVRVDDAEDDRTRCFRENADGAATLAARCADAGVQLLTISSDLVFDGLADSPYVERDAVAPRNVYGASKSEAERRVLELLPSALVVRTSAFFGPWDEYNFLAVAIRELAAGRPFTAADDATISPTYVPDLTNAALDLLIDAECGVWHLANAGSITWADFARRTAELAGLDARLVDARQTWELGLRAPRPLYTALASERGTLLPPIENAICRYLGARGLLSRAPRVRPEIALAADPA